MGDTAMELFSSVSARNKPIHQHAPGVLPYQALRELARTNEILASSDFDASQFQPASLDLRLSDVAYRVRASFLPGPHARVMEKVEQFGMHEVDISNGAVLEKGCVYIVPLMEKLALKGRLTAVANPKSSTGRLDVFTRIITDYGTEFDRIEHRSEQKSPVPLFVEIAPRTFSIFVRKGSRLAQLRLRRNAAFVAGQQLKRLQQEHSLVSAEPGQEAVKDDKVAVTLDLAGHPQSRIVGFRAKKHTDVIDIEARQKYDPAEYWDPILTNANRRLILDPEDFYILATKEFVSIPPTLAAEMVAYDVMAGEFRVHYAGFFDPGFGYSPDGRGRARAVLEVRSQVPFVLEHGQIVGSLRFERLSHPPDKLYGTGLGSSYQDQGLALGKQFKPVTDFT